MKEKIIIFRNGSYGDALVALPCLKLIQNEYKSSEIFYLTLQNNNTNFFNPKELFDQFGLKFKYKIIQKEKLYLFKFIFFFLSNNFDKMYYLKEDPTNFISKKNSKFSLKLNILIEFFFFKILKVKKIQGLEYQNFETKNNKKESLKLIERFHKKEINEEKILKFFSKPKNFKYKSDIILCLGGKFPIKDWGLSNWIKLIRIIISNNKKQKFIIIGGGNADHKKAQILKLYFPNNCIPFLNKNFSQLMKKIMNSKLYIGHDTANMHLCALLGLKTISIFASRDIKGRWFPIGNKNINFYKDINCSNCKLINSCNYNKRCINSFKPNSIYNKIKKYF